VEDTELRNLARRRVAFRSHLLVYVVVIAFLGIINLITSRDFPWFLFPAGGWGIGIIFHLISAHGHGGLSVEKEYEKLKKKESRKQSQ